LLEGSEIIGELCVLEQELKDSGYGDKVASFLDEIKKD
jgi:hypothetical protein